MSPSAQALIASAPLGALVAYSDGRPRPPERFRRKLAEWRRFNGVGRLDSVTPAEMRGAREVPARFVLHVGDFGSFGVVVLTVRMCFDAHSPLTFQVIDAEDGAVVGFVTDGVHLELGGVFAEEGAAAAWVEAPRTERAFLSHLVLAADGSLLSSNFDSFRTIDSNRPGLGTLNLAGNDLTQAPRYKYNLSAEYTATRSFGDFTFRGEVEGT